MSAKSKPRGKAAREAMDEELSFEEALDRLEELVERLEDGKISLDESLAAYVEGTRLVKRCRERLDHAELVIRELSESQEGFELGPSNLGAGPGKDDEDEAVDEDGNHA